MPKNNGLSPASQPWARELEARLKSLESSVKNAVKPTKSAPVQNVDLDNLNVGALWVGGDPGRVTTLAEPLEWSKSVQGNTVTFTAPVPTFTYEEDEIGFRLDVELVATSTVDYPLFTDSWTPPTVPDPEDPEEPESEALAGEETTYTTSFQYSIDDPEDELYEPIPTSISVSFTAKSPLDVTILESSLKLVTPGVPGITLTAEGDILFRDEYGSDRPISELTPEDAQAIEDTAKNLADAKAEIDRVDKEASGNFEELGGKLNTAFPNDIFDVDLAIEQAKRLADQKFNDSITGTVIEYARNSNETSAPTTGWSTTPPTRTPGTFIWMRTIVSYGSGDTTTTDPVLLTGNAGAQGPEGPQGPQGVPGPDGPQGQALYTWIKYAPNGNPTSGEMSDSPVGMTYMGIAHNQTSQTEGTDPTAYSWSLIQGPQGDTGIQGPDGSDGQSLYTWVKYAPNGSPTASQITDTPQATSTHIGLAYNKTTASESTVPGDYTWSLIKGPKGDKGDTGSDGLPGAAGKGIKSTDISYARSTSGATAPTSGWQAQPPTPIKGQYLWTRTIWTYTDDATETGYSTAYWATDGAKGADGIAGKDGVGISNTAITYAKSASGTTPPTTGWVSQPPSANAGEYMWTRTIWTYTDNTTETGYSVGKIGDTGDKGDTGAKGDTGVSVTSVTPFYRQAASQPAKPSGMTPSGWATTEPAYAENMSVWRSDRVVYSNGTVAWTDVSKSSSYELAKVAMTTADGKNSVTYTTFSSSTLEPPGTPPSNESGVGRRQFDMHRNRRTNGEIIGEWMWSGSAWVPVQMGDGVLRSLDVGKLTAGQANLETGVVDKLWANLAVVNKLQALEGWIGGALLADGAVTARTLNVVPDEGTGGMELKPEGLRIIPNNVGEGTAISLRSDEENWISFAQAGRSTFSVSPEGDASFHDVAVANSLTVDGVDIVADYNSKFEPRPAGIITPVVGLNNNVPIPTNETALMGVSASIPDGPGQRMVRINASLQLHNFADHVQIQVRGVTSGNVTVASPSLLVTNVNTSSSGQTPVPIEYVWRVPSGVDIQVLLTIKSNNSRTGGRVNLQGQTHLYIEDLGTATGYAGVNAGGVLGGTRTFTKTYLPTWGRSYTEENTFYAFDGGNDTRVDYAVAFQGVRDQFSSLRSMVGFDRAQILSDLSGATVDKVEIEFVNRSAWFATWLPRIGLHNATSRPATFSTVVNEIYNPSVSRGQRVRAALPSNYVNGWKSGLYSGFVFYDTTKSTSKSFTGSVAVKDCRIHITYRK